jgi:hypothetical protein
MVTAPSAEKRSEPRGCLHETKRSKKKAKLRYQRHRNRVLVIGCPELEGADYVEKLKEIFRLNDILSIAVVRMDAPCCSKLADTVVEAVRRNRKDIPIQVTTVFAEGEIVEQKKPSDCAQPDGILFHELLNCLVQVIYRRKIV